MIGPSLSDQFRHAPLEFLEREFAASGDVVRTGERELCLGDPLAARSVLHNENNLYRDHSDFFHTRRGLFGPRASQLKIAHHGRRLLRNFLRMQANDAMASFVDSNLPARSEWPDSGNRLVYRYLLPVLVSKDNPPALRRLLDDIVERAVLANARSRQAAWRRMILQFRTTWLLSSAIETRRARAGSQPADLLDVIAYSAQPGQSADELAEVFLSFLFAIAGSLGFVLAWSVYLLGTHRDCEAPAQWVVQEALRLWPVSWMLARHPARDHEVSGVRVGMDDVVVACPYLVHRNPTYWSNPREFRPDRWAARESWRNPAFIPFGYGPHRCVAAELATRLVSEFLAAITKSNRLSIVAHDTRPSIAAAMAPPPFTLTLERHPSEH
jgi:cytochrome P450